MTKEQHIQYWISNADRDLHRAERCFDDKDFVFCLFCLHLSLEKLIKGLWVKNNIENHPPRIHNLVRLLDGSPLKLTEDEMVFLSDMNRFQLEGRYPDYTEQIFQFCSDEYTKEMLEKGKTLRLCLIKNLQ